jgi:hypothetical protein
MSLSKSLAWKMVKSIVFFMVQVGVKKTVVNLVVAYAHEYCKDSAGNSGGILAGMPDSGCFRRNFLE